MPSCKTITLILIKLKNITKQLLLGSKCQYHLQIKPLSHIVSIIPAYYKTFVCHNNTCISASHWLLNDQHLICLPLLRFVMKTVHFQ